MVTWLADQIGSKPQYVSNLLSGAKNASLERWQEIADVLGVHVSDLLRDDEPDELAALLRRQQAELQRLRESMGDQYPALRERTPPYPGVVELLADRARCSALRVTEDELSMPWQGRRSRGPLATR